MTWGDGDHGDFDAMRSRIHSPDVLDALERRFWREVWRSPVLDAVEEQEIEARRYGPIQATTIAGRPEESMLNLVLGAAADGAVEDGHLAESLDWVESLEVDCRVPVAAGRPESGAAEDLLNQRGYERCESRVRFLRDTSPPDFPEPPGVEVGELHEFTEGFGSGVSEAFELERQAGFVFDCLPERDTWRCYYAQARGQRGYAYASMMLDYKIAQLGFAATPEAARGNGCHMALLHRRIVDAAKARRHTLLAETREPLADRDGPSPGCRNLLRAGFKQVSASMAWRPLRV